MKRTVVIIGGGVGGLAAALRLAKDYRVILLEKNERVGGKLNLWEAPHPNRPADRPFRFDTGPSLLTMPYVFMDLFAAVGEDVREHLKITRLDPIARFQWQDGTQFELKATEEALLAEIARLWPADAVGFARLMERGRQIWQISESFLSSAPEQLTRDGVLSAAKLVTVPFRIGMFRRFDRVINQYIREPRLRDVLYQYATYSGASPFKALGTLAVIPWVEHYFGGWHIEGGMYELAAKLGALAAKLGVEIRTGVDVSEILIEQAPITGKPVLSASGVRLADGTTIEADAVIANADLVYAYRNLIPPAHRPHYPDEKLDEFDPGGTGLILMLGIDGTYPQLAHHTKLMPDNYAEELHAMFQARTIPQDPCIYVCAPTRTDRSLAPEGCESLFVLASAPPMVGTSIDWETAGRRYRDQLVHTLEHRWGLTDLGKRIVVERMMTPASLKEIYNANAGSIYGFAINSLRAALTRPQNRDRHINNLYFAGGAAHPGGGLPLVALSGKIVSELVREDLGLVENPKDETRITNE